MDIPTPSQRGVVSAAGQQVKMEYEEGKCIASSQAALAPYHDD
jgi:hypothetical protein